MNDGLARTIQELSSATKPILRFTHHAAELGERPAGPGGSVAILSASFNPLTLAHTAMLDVADSEMRGSEWLLVLSLSNVDKKVSGYPIAERLRFLHLWARERPRVSVALCSHGRFVEKLQAIRAVKPSQRLVFLVGYDTLVRVFDPGYYRDMTAELNALFSQCEFIAVNRGPATTETIRQFKESAEVVPFAQRIHVVELPEPFCRISSTTVRNMVRAGQSVDEMVPKEIAPFLTMDTLGEE